MKDRNVQFPNRYKMTKVPGTDDIFDLIPAPGTVFEEGDFLNKSTLLTDALCTALGLATTATPTQAMEKLRQLATADVPMSRLSGVLSVEKGGLGTNNLSTFAASLIPFLTSDLNIVRVVDGAFQASGTTLKLTFPFPPKVCFLFNSNNQFVCWALGSTQYLLVSTGSVPAVFRVAALDGNTLILSSISQGMKGNYVCFG